MTQTLTITHLYPDNLNLYGDIGNIIALQRRCQWLGIDCTIQSINLKDTLVPGQTDFYFMGGGQDNDQLAVVSDFHNLKENAVNTDTESGIPFLGVCGGYQLMGNTFVMGDSQETQGLGIIDVSTKAPSKAVKERCIGNLIVAISGPIYDEMQTIYQSPRQIPNTLVGFENHSGQTYLGKAVTPLAQTLAGFGNNYLAEYEGARYKNVFGSYMHGAILPKNPHFADYLIWLALVRKYEDSSIRLTPLDDKEEFATHQYLVQRYGKG